MKVYRVLNNVNDYQYFLTEKEEDVLMLEMMDCTPKLETWRPPSVDIYQPHHRGGDFYQFGASTLITSPRATDFLREYLEMAGELLQLPFNNQIFTVLNVTECINCLDHERTEWIYDEFTGRRSRPKEYVFHPDRFASSDLFKIPETCRAEILVIEQEDNLEEGFRYAVTRAQLQGLIFEEIWNSEL